MIPTVSVLHAHSRRLDRKIRTAATVLNAMQRGCALHLQYANHKPVWLLTDGRQVADAVARMVTASASVVSVDAALFAGCPAQTWRWWSNAEDPIA